MHTVRQELPNTQELLQICSGNRNLYRLLLGKNLHICLSADICDSPFQAAYTGFSGIAADDFPNSIIADAQLRLLQTMLFHLLGNQMILRNHQLFFIRVRSQFNDLHAVQQRSGNGIQGIGGSDKHDIAEIHRNLNEMIAIRFILLRIQHFQQRGTGVAAIIAAHFVHFVQQQQRISGTCLGHGCDNSAGHCPNIGFSVTADIRLVPNTPQCNTRHFSVQALGNGIGNRCLANTRRANQTNDLGGHLGSHSANSQCFQNTLLYFFQTKMFLLQNFGRFLDIYRFPGGLIPGEIQNGIQIIAQYRCFRRSKGLLFQPIQIFQKFFLPLFFQVQ